MSTKHSTGTKLTIAIAGLLIALAGLVTIGLLLREYGPGDMGNGFLVGAGITTLAASIAGWRALRRPESATTIERAWTSTGDERDKAVLTNALAVVGFCAPLAVGAASITIALGVELTPVIAILNFGLIAIFIGAFIYQNKRN